MPSSTTIRLNADDGGEIAATVRGAGPPVVLLPAGPGDAAASWEPLILHLEAHLSRPRPIPAGLADPLIGFFSTTVP